MGRIWLYDSSAVVALLEVTLYTQLVVGWVGFEGPSWLHSIDSKNEWKLDSVETADQSTYIWHLQHVISGKLKFSQGSWVPPE